jgi:hypothetical protein
MTEARRLKEAMANMRAVRFVVRDVAKLLASLVQKLGPLLVAGTRVALPCGTTVSVPATKRLQHAISSGLEVADAGLRSVEAFVDTVATDVSSFNIHTNWKSEVLSQYNRQGGTHPWLMMDKHVEQLDDKTRTRTLQDMARDATAAMNAFVSARKRVTKPTGEKTSTTTSVSTASSSSSTSTCASTASTTSSSTDTTSASTSTNTSTSTSISISTTATATPVAPTPSASPAIPPTVTSRYLDVAPRKKQRLSRRGGPDYPAPANGAEYASQYEFCAAMETAVELAGPLCVGAAKATVLAEVRADMRKRKWVTTSESQMKRWWAKYKDPLTRHLVPANRWKHQGRNKLLPVLETQAVSKAAAKGGCVVFGRQLVQTLVGKVQAAAAARGEAPLPDHLVVISDSTRRRTEDAAEMHPTASTLRKANIVARYRDLAARDLRNNISWAIMICCAMFYISADPLTDAELAARARNPTWLWWSKLFGEALNWRPIQTKLCLGVDDVTVVAKQGATPTEYEWHAVDLDEADHRYSYFTVQDAEGRNFLLRARFTMAAAGEGHKCRIIMTISNLTLEQLGGQSFKVIKVRGCTVNAGWNPSAAHDPSTDNYGLSRQQEQQPPTNGHGSGNYVTIDTETVTVFRSGKAKVFIDRFRGHAAMAKKSNRSGQSQLYTFYPSSELKAKEDDNPLRKGWFEDLHFGIGMGFDRRNAAAVKWLTAEKSDGGLFNWGFGVGAMLTRSTSTAATDARLAAVEYLLEMVYSLLLDANECVSLSGGFESFLGEYGGKHTVVEPETERSEE